MRLLRSLIVLATILCNSGPLTAAGFDARSSNAAGVTVKITPGDLSPQAAVWEFTVVLDTHTQNLLDDLAKNAVLIDARGRRHAPLAWEGAPPGGHHRSGVLRFKGLGEQGDTLELQIRRPGEQAPRVFRWKAK